MISDHGRPVHAPSGSDDPDRPSSLTEAWRRRVAREPDAGALAYFDGAMTVRDLDEASDALAAGLRSLGTERGDRVGVCLQNVPQFPLAFLAAWKLGATIVLLNPMYRGEELRRLVVDAGAVGVICSDSVADETATTLRGGPTRWLVHTSSRSFQRRDDPRVFGDVVVDGPSAGKSLESLLEGFRGAAPPPVTTGRDDLALLTYTSGTTGPPKGAMNTHGNLLAVTGTFSEHVDLRPGDAVFAMAPLFHITGAVINATIALLHDAVLVMADRFEPDVALDAFVEHQVTFTIGSITAYNAIYRRPHASREHFASMRSLYSGGAPIPPSTVDRFIERFGVPIHNAYGMTETSAAVVAVPPGASAPIDPVSGALSVGRSLPGLQVRVVDSSGSPVGPNTQGELILRGPQVVPGYWCDVEATRSTLSGGWLHTGDGAVMDADGWIFIVDRLKDQINTSGYKVWPREVEDVLAAHPSVLEAAVVGAPDDYRGEVVVAYVAIRGGCAVTKAELIVFVREHLAAYKCPRRIHLVSDLPKTQTGKIRRNVLKSGRPEGEDRPRRDSLDVSPSTC